MPGELVRVTVRPSSFRAPADLAACPVIMVRVVLVLVRIRQYDTFFFVVATVFVLGGEGGRGILLMICAAAAF